ncbi:MAG: helix-turn-helix domain-containing protein [Desulfobacteraceae bacterium]|nr:helix-turn-helix domain-containing protein [Desulfobacteraceae bacterium]
MIVIRIGQLADQLGVHRNTIRNWIRSGRLPARSMSGKRYLLTEADFSKICQEFGIDRSALRLKHVPGAPLMSREMGLMEENVRRIGQPSGRLLGAPSWGEACMTCGSCASACPISGVDGLDPRKAVRMAVLGLEEELLASQWPWKCTMCGKCERACPMNVEIVALIQRVRGLRDRDKVPGPLHKGVLMCLAKGNNLGIPKVDFVSLLDEMSREMVDEGCEGFTSPVDRKGSRIMMLVNSKEPFAEPDDMKHWWKIFHAAGESWTIPSENWEGVNWALFTGDDESLKTIVGRIVENMYRLECKTLLLPELGHSYYATRYGLQTWFREDLKNFTVTTVFDLLLSYINEGRIKIDPSRHKMLTTYNDPCHYGRKSLKTFGQGYFEEPRAIIKKCAPNYVDLYPNRADNYCCGAGGGGWATPFKEERVYFGRFKANQIATSRAGLVITACHNCRDQITKSLRYEYDLKADVKYIWELVADSLVLPGNRGKRT